MIATETRSEVEELREAILPYLLNDDERATLQVRDGVTFSSNYEVSFSGRMGTLLKTNLPAIKMNPGGLAVFLPTFLDKLRGNRLQQQITCLECRSPRYLHYEWKDVVREVDYALQSILVAAGKKDRVNLASTPVGQAKEILALQDYLIKTINTHEHENRILRAELEALNLPGRTVSALKRNGIDAVAKLVAMTEKECLALEGIGPLSKLPIRSALEEHRIKFREDE